MADLASYIQKAEKIVFFTGAGISTESGIADFRSPGGIWTKMKPIYFQDFVADEQSRMEDWRRRFRFQKEFDAAPLNDGHRAVASVLNSRSGLGLITQNIDGLHQRSGVDDASIVEIHGNGTNASCLDCGLPMSLQEAQSLISKTGESPKCGDCDGLVKANIISFGQPMPQDKVVEAEKLALNCDLFVVLGSSLVVQPAAGLPLLARNNGARLVIVNRENTPLDPLAHLVLHSPLGETLKKALEKQPS